MTIYAAVSRLPASVRIGPYDIAIAHGERTQLALEAADHYGEFSAHEQEIRIRSRSSSAQGDVDTFLHECMHAIFWVYGVGHADDEERIVSMLGTALLAMHRDNPWLTKWLDESLHPKPDFSIIKECVKNG